ncbi:MAG: hypothetical protein QM756_26115 [Polyangiaceae bacterium]
MSAPRSPAPSPVSPKRKSPPKPSALPDSVRTEPTLIKKKLNLARFGFSFVSAGEPLSSLHAMLAHDSAPAKIAAENCLKFMAAQ